MDRVWYRITVGDASGGMYFEARVPFGNLSDAMRLAAGIADNYCRALLPGDPPVRIEIVKL